MATITRLYHGSRDAEAVRREGFRRPDACEGARWQAPWLSATEDPEVATGYGEVLVIDATALRIMPEAEAVAVMEALLAADPQGAEDPGAFVAAVRARGYDAFVHPQEPWEVGIVAVEAIRLVEAPHA